MDDKALCRRVAEWIAQGAGGVVCCPRFPDETTRDKKAVDMSFHVGFAPYVLEHTKVVSFVNHLRDDQWTLSLLAGLTAALERRSDLPDGQFWVSVERGSLAGVKGRKLIVTCDEIVAHLVGCESLIPEREADDPRVESRRHVALTHIPQGATITRQSSNGRCDVTVTRDVTGYSVSRVDVAAKALRDKLPKLDSAKAAAGARSALVLEFSDIQLDNASAVTDAVRAVAESDNSLPMPDSILVVDTSWGPVQLGEVYTTQMGFLQHVVRWQWSEDTGRWEAEE